MKKTRKYKAFSLNLQRFPWSSLQKFPKIKYIGSEITKRYCFSFIRWWPLISRCNRVHLQIHFLLSCCSSVSLKAQPHWSIRRDGHYVCRAPASLSLSNDGELGSPVARKWCQLPQPSSSSSSSSLLDVNSLSSQVEQSHWASTSILPC